ncbi:MAG TPA: DNA sulfur modification protein DndB [Conexibacter sp.]
MANGDYSRTLRALEISAHEAVAVVPVAEFLDLTVPGRAFLTRAQNETMTQRAVDAMRPLHALIQRDLTGQKLRNARGDLARYLVEEWLEEADEDGPGPGVMGPFIVVTPTPLRVADGLIALPGSHKFIIEDGESRGEAVLWLLEQGELSGEQEEALLSKRIAMVIHHGVPVETAGKWFADINGKGVGVNANLIVARDFTDPYREVAERAFERLDVTLEREARQVRASHPEVFTVLQARLAVTAMAKGPSAVGYGAGRIPPNGTDFERLEDAAVLWFEHVFGALGRQAFKDKGRVLRSVPILAAIGAVGRPFYDGGATAMRAARRTIKDPTIDWGVGEHWSGICGKVNPTTGVFSVGSAKEYGKAAFVALTEVGSDPYQQIRPAEALAEAA